VRRCHRRQLLVHSCRLRHIHNGSTDLPLGRKGLDETNAKATVDSCRYRMTCHNRWRATLPRPGESEAGDFVVDVWVG
jgi:hypothetical protein